MKVKNCPVEEMLHMVSGKWKIPILRQLADGKPVRFKMIRSGIPEVSGKVLTQQLRALESDGLIQRAFFQEIPPRVEYQITESGLCMVRAMKELRKWGKGIKGVDMSTCEACEIYGIYPDE